MRELIRTALTNPQAFYDAIESKWQSGFSWVTPSGAVFLEEEGWGNWKGRLAIAPFKQQCSSSEKTATEADAFGFAGAL